MVGMFEAYQYGEETELEEVCPYCERELFLDNRGLYLICRCGWHPTLNPIENGVLRRGEGYDGDEEL